MKKMLRFLLIALTVCCFVGCDDTTDNNTTENTTNVVAKTNSTNRIAVICYLTKVDPKYYDGWNGDCPGTDVDAKTFASMCQSKGIPYVMLANSQCTATNIYQNVSRAYQKLDTSKDNLFIFFYSGHGGQAYATEGSEKDGLDETLCFWDGQFRDNYVWNVMCRAKPTTRIWFVTDCCNSGTNYQLPYVFGRNVPNLPTPRGTTPNMIHYGGCNDGESSYGSSYGGVFTSYLKDVYTNGITYKNLFTITKTKMKRETQVPTYATTGKSFENLPAFE